MTTAPDLPVVHGPLPQPAIAPSPVPAPRPALTLVPAPEPEPTPEFDFDETLRRATPRLQRYAARRLQDRHEAEEVVQEALLRGFQHRHQLATEDDVMAWLTVVTGRLVIDRLRVRGRSTPVAELPAGCRSARDTAEVVVARDEARLALDALEAMPSRQAAVLWAREVEGLSYDDISTRFALSEPTVRSLLHRARKTLRREYAQRGGTLPTAGLVALAPWLRGLHWAAKLRSAARRSITAGAVGVTGIALVTAAPIWSHKIPTTPAPVNIPAVHQAATSTPHVAAKPQRHVVARPAAHTPVAAATRAQPAEVHHQLLRAVRACSVGNTGASAGCTTHHSPTLYVRLPIGPKWAGLSTNEISCTALPATPLTECDSQKGAK